MIRPNLSSSAQNSCTVSSGSLTMAMPPTKRSRSLQPWCSWEGPADDRLYETVYITLRPRVWADIRQHNFWMFPMNHGFGEHIPLYSSATHSREALLRMEGAAEENITHFWPSAGGQDVASHVGPGPLLEAVLIELFLPLHIVLDLARARALDRHPFRPCWRFWDDDGIQLTDHRFRLRTVYNIGNTLL